MGRIGNGRKRGLRLPASLALLMTLVLGVLGWAAKGREQRPLPSPSIATAPQSMDFLEGRVVGIADGDTITVLDASNTAWKIRLLGIDAPGDAVYISGDTVWYEGTAEIAKRYAPKLVVLFTGSAQTRGKFHLTMNTNDAIDAAAAFPDAKVVTVHNHGWEHFKESQDDIAQAFTALGLASRLDLLELGKPHSIEL